MKPLRILLVEDNEAHAELIRRTLQDHQVATSIYHVLDGEAALDFLHHRNAWSDESQSPRPDLILLDVRLPKIDGLEVLREIRASEELQAIPTVILTTSDTESDVARAYRLHANSYVVKPIDYDVFEELLQDLGFYWLVWNRSV